jgi:hypothetical protein
MGLLDSRSKAGGHLQFLLSIDSVDCLVMAVRFDLELLCRSDK